MKRRRFRILGAALAALLPACGGGGGGSGGETANPAFPVTMTEPKGGQTFTAPATISLSAVPTHPAGVAKVEFLQGPLPVRPVPNTWQGGTVVATSTQPPFQATWAQVPAGIHTLIARATDTLGAETFSNTVTISVLPPGQTPGGWTPIAKVWDDPSGFWFVDAERGWTVGRTGAILHTVDGGATWMSQSSGMFQDLDLGNVQFVDAHHGWIIGNVHHVGGGALLRTTDGGATWTRLSLDIGVASLSFVDADVGWVLGGDGLFGTKDGGVTWTLLPTGLPGIGLQTVLFVDRQSGWALGTVDFRGVILHTTDGGLTWNEQLRTDLSVAVRAMDFVSPTTGWVSRVGFLPEHNKILFTTDGGATWTEQTYPGSGGIYALDFVSPKQGWGATLYSATIIIHTEDGGASWVVQEGPGEPFGPGFVDMHAIDANRGWAIRQDSLLLKTTTGGKAP